MPDDNQVLARIIPIKIFVAVISDEIIFILEFKRHADLYSRVAEENFFVADPGEMRRGQAVQEVKKFSRDVLLATVEERRLIAEKISDEQTQRNFLLVQKQLHKFFVHVAAQENKIFTLVEFVEAEQRLKIFLSFFPEIIAQENDEVFICHGNFFQKRFETVSRAVHIANRKDSFIGLDRQRERFKIRDKKFFIFHS